MFCIREIITFSFCMIILIVLWMVPLWFKGEYPAFTILDRVCTSIFIVDYLLRWATADFKLKRGKISFLIYPFTPMAILDLVSFIPSFAPANASFKTVRVLRVIGALRAFKLIRHSQTIHILIDAARVSACHFLSRSPSPSSTYLQALRSCSTSNRKPMRPSSTHSIGRSSA